MNAPGFRALTAQHHTFVQACREQPSQVLLAMDFDGTLAQIVDDPDAATIHPDAAAALSDVGPALGRLAIITGRPVAQVRQLAALDSAPGLERLSVLGQYGVERWDRDTGKLRVPEPPAGVHNARKALVRLLARLAAEGKPVAGTHLEDKGRAIGVHTRRAEDPEAAMVALDDPVRDIAQEYGLVVEPGRNVLELRASGKTKADALREIGAESRPRAVAFCGDDLGDVPAFELLQSLATHGIITCIVVSASSEQPELTRYADVVADGPAGVAAWLRSLL